MATKPWHDINEPGFSFEKKDEQPAKEPVGRVDEAGAPPTKQRPAAEYRIISVRAIEPVSGFRRNKPFDIEGEIEPLVEKITRPRIVLYPVGLYKGTEDNFYPNGIEVFPDKNGKFRGRCSMFFNPMEYENDTGTSDDATWVLEIRAEGNTAEQNVTSEPLTFPQPEKPFVTLRKGHYDDNGAARYEQAKQGTDYIPGDAVTLLQRDLILLRFLPKGTGEDDGFFGSRTDEAVREFQRYAIDSYRMPLKLGKLVEAEKTLQQSAPDGIVGPKTRDELDVWKDNEWVRPAVTLRRGDYDDEGVSRRLGRRGEDDHHIKTPVRELQQGLKERGFDNVGEADGWFWDMTEEALIDFQTCASETTRVVKGEVREVDVTFTGTPNGVLDEPTREELFNVWQAEDHRPVEISDTAMIFAAPGMYNGEGGWFVCEEERVDNLMSEVKELEELQGEIRTFRESCTSSRISESTTQKARELEEKVADKFKGLTTKPGDAIQELLLVKSNPRWGGMSKRVYVRPYQTKNGAVGGHFRRNAHGGVKKALRKWLKQENEKGNADGGMDAKLKAMLWESDKLDEKWPWKFKTLEDKKGTDTAVGYFEGSYEAQFFRFVAGANAGSEFNFEHGPKLKLGAEAHASYSLAEGTVSGLWSLPGEDGFNMFDHLVLSKNAREALKDGYECRFRLTTKADAKAFVGAAITAAVSLPCIDLSKNDKLDTGGNNTASAGANAKAFAGASLEGKIASIIEWRDQLEKEFDGLAEVGATGAGSAGIGGEAKFEIKYDNGKIRFEAGAMAVLGLGGKAGCAFELGVDEGIELLAHLYNCIDFHRMDSVAQAAFEVYLNVAFMQFVVAGKLAGKIGDSISSWLADRKEKEEGLQQTKQTIYTNLNDKKKLQNSPPEALGELLQTITEFPEEEDFNAIIKVLQSAESRNDNAHKLKWIIRSYHDPELSRKLAGKDEKTQDRMKKTALEEGIAELMEFGGNLDNLLRNQYVNQMQVTLQRNGVSYAE